jgi:hypothetical protein
MFKYNRNSFLPTDKRIPLNEIRDEENEEFIFQTMHMRLLLKLANGKIDGKKLALEELKNRGYDKKGEWVGWDEDPAQSARTAQRRVAVNRSGRNDRASKLRH